MVQAIVDEHGCEGFTALQEALAAACVAKNSTLTRDGYTPNQRVYGFECRWPSLLDENSSPSFAEGLSIEPEVSRARKMRRRGGAPFFENLTHQKDRSCLEQECTSGYHLPRKGGTERGDSGGTFYSSHQGTGQALLHLVAWEVIAPS